MPVPDLQESESPEIHNYGYFDNIVNKLCGKEPVMQGAQHTILGKIYLSSQECIKAESFVNIHGLVVMLQSVPFVPFIVAPYNTQ